MNIKIIIYCAAVVLSSCSSFDEVCGDSLNEPIGVQDLLGRPQCYNGRVIRVEGYLSSDNAFVYIFDYKEDVDLRRYSMSVAIERSVIDRDAPNLLKLPDGLPEYTIIHGNFVSSKFIDKIEMYKVVELDL